MGTDAKELDALRTETQQLGSRITRLCIILIGALAVVTFTITNAIEKTDIRKLKTEVDNTHNVTETNYLQYQDKVLKSKTLSPGGDSEIEKDVEISKELWKKAVEKESEARDKYNALALDSFSISPSVLGSSVRIDLRAWTYSIPFILLAAVVYIQILRKKQSALATIAAHHISSSDETKGLDRLTFSERPGLDPPYTRHPFRLEQTIYLSVVTILLSLIVNSLSSADADLLGLGTIETIQYVLMFLTIASYGLSYYYFVSRSIDKQVSYIAGWTDLPRLPIRAWRKLRNVAQSLSSKVKPNIKLTTGALLVLLSLLLSTSASCGQNSELVRLRGYKLLEKPGGRAEEVDWALDKLEKLIKGGPDAVGSVESSWHDPGGGWWISTVMHTKVALYWRNSIHNLGRLAYVLSLALAGLSILVAFGSARKYKLFGHAKVQAVLFLISITISLYVTTDFAFSAFWFKDEVFLVSNFFWLVPVIILFRVIFLNDRDPLGDLDTTKTFLVALVLPLLVSATIYVFYLVSYRFFGVLVFFVGINFLSLSYLELVKSHRAVDQLTGDVSETEPTAGGT